MVRNERRSWSIGSARFGRDVLASVVATGVATIAFSHLAHEPAPAALSSGETAKSSDRLSWDVENVPVRATRIYDTVAMFGMPQVAFHEWTAPAIPLKVADSIPVRVPRPNTAAALPRMADAAEVRRSATALPPKRPAATVETAALSTLPPAATVADVGVPARHLQVLGWNVPGTDLLPRLPSAKDALDKVAALGDGAASLGGAIVESVGLK